MDPATALAITGLIVQVVDIGWKVARYCRTVYVDGSTKRQNDTQEYAATLTTSCTNLQQSLNGLTMRHPNRADQELLEIASQCLQTGTELGEELAHATSGPNRGIKAVANRVMSSMRHASRVKKLRLQLSDYQRLLDTKYLESQHQTAKDILEKQTDFFEAQSLDMQYVISRLASGFTETDALCMSKAGQIRDDVKDEHEDTRKQVMVAVEAAMRKLQADRRCDKVLEDLAFKGMTNREVDIESGSYVTFDDSVLKWRGDSARLSFAGWLRSTDKIYWIEGKPGSGKSTLMKFLANKSRVASALRPAVPPTQHEIVVLKYFAWAGGAHLQRNIHGMLSSLLHQLFTTDPELLPDLMSSQGHNFPDRFDDRSTLLKLLQHAVSASQCATMTFIDGLDDFLEDPEDLVNVLDVLQQVDMKICFASRPDISFTSHFRSDCCIRLQELTRPALYAYVSACLSGDKKIKASMPPNNMLGRNNIGHFEGSITDRAQGVFLWAKLALRQITLGIRGGVDWDTLYELLDYVPPEVDAIYQQKWLALSRKPPSFRKQAIAFLCLAVVPDIQLLQASIAVLPDPSETIMVHIIQLSGALLQSRCDKAKMSVDAHCEGFVEVASTCAGHRDCTEPDVHYQHHRLRYIHRTARDFVKGTLKAESQCWLTRRKQTWSQYCRSWMLMTLVDPSAPEFSLRKRKGQRESWYETAEWSMFPDLHVSEDANTRAAVARERLDASSELADALWHRDRVDLFSPFTVATDFLGAAVEMGYLDYVRDKLSTFSRVPADTLNYLLLCAVRSQPS